MADLLKVLKVDAPRFNGQNVHNWVYMIEKFFSLYAIPSLLRLQVVAFHLDGEAASWYQWMDRNGSGYLGEIHCRPTGALWVFHLR